MSALTIEPTYRVLLGEPAGFHLVLVGVGGTGANLALILGRLAFHARQRHLPLRLTFVDPDIVAPVNLGRQPFCPAELGLNKAVCLAQRLNLAFGLAITAVPQPFQAEMALANRQAVERNWRTLLLGCVDNHLARRELARAVARRQGEWWALDCGNAYSSGQVLIGNLADAGRLRLDKLGLCSGLPAPYLQEPALLAPEPDEPAVSCAALAEQGEQSLLVNVQAAAVAGQLVHDFIFQRQVVQMAVAFNLSPFIMRATPITRQTLAPYLAR
jgi:PRTRC genetic system ThiF family protein